MKLEIDLVPRTAWYSNLRNKLKRHDWDKIRKQSYKDAGNRCSICRADARLNCHEIWSYDDKEHIQELKGFVALCNDCHMIKHIGFAGIKASEGELDFEKLIMHFMNIEDAFSKWSERSEHMWTTLLNKWTDLV